MQRPEGALDSVGRRGTPCDLRDRLPRRRSGRAPQHRSPSHRARRRERSSHLGSPGAAGRVRLCSESSGRYRCRRRRARRRDVGGSRGSGPRACAARGASDASAPSPTGASSSSYVADPLAAPVAAGLASDGLVRPGDLRLAQAALGFRPVEPLESTSGGVHEAHMVGGEVRTKAADRRRRPTCARRGRGASPAP